MTQIYANNFTTLALGRRGENLARKVVFDVRDLESLYGPGDAEVIYQRPGDAQPYARAVQRAGTLGTWDVTATDTEMSKVLKVIRETKVIPARLVLKVLKETRATKVTPASKALRVTPVLASRLLDILQPSTRRLLLPPLQLSVMLMA